MADTGLINLSRKLYEFKKMQSQLNKRESEIKERIAKNENEVANLASNLTEVREVVIAQAKVVFGEWDGNSTNYTTGEMVLYNSVLYKVLSDHTSQSTWRPDLSPSLFAKVLNKTTDNTIPEWVQPDSTNAYSTGDKVLFKGQIYISLIDNNVWSPIDYPAGWQLSQE